jgi:hypothetical protein
MTPEISAPIQCAQRPGGIVPRDEYEEKLRRDRGAKVLRCNGCGTKLVCSESRETGYCRACVPEASGPPHCGYCGSEPKVGLVKGMCELCYGRVYRARSKASAAARRIKTVNIILEEE